YLASYIRYFASIQLRAQTIHLKNTHSYSKQTFILKFLAWNHLILDQIQKGHCFIEDKC
ncbi:hypothetical protein KSS87_015038, partial [Heliosperma pusillum]